MHELSIAQVIVKTALKEASKVGAKRICQIHAKVSESANHIEEASSLLFCLEAVAKGTIAEGAEMKVELMPPTLRCKECDFTFTAQGGVLVCPRCKSGNLEGIDDEICLESIQVE